IDLLQVDDVFIAQDMGFQRDQQFGAARVEGCLVTMPRLEGKRLVKVFGPVKKKSLRPHHAPRLPRLAATPSSGAASHHQCDSPKATAPCATPMATATLMPSRGHRNTSSVTVALGSRAAGTGAAGEAAAWAGWAAALGVASAAARGSTAVGATRPVGVVADATCCAGDLSWPTPDSSSRRRCSNSANNCSERLRTMGYPNDASRPATCIVAVTSSLHMVRSPSRCSSRLTTMPTSMVVPVALSQPAAFSDTCRCGS